MFLEVDIAEDHTFHAVTLQSGYSLLKRLFIQGHVWGDCVLHQGNSNSLRLTGDEASPSPVEGDPPELTGYEIDQIGDLIALCQSKVTGKAAILSSTPGDNDFHDIYLLTPLQMRSVVQQAEH